MTGAFSGDEVPPASLPRLDLFISGMLGPTAGILQLSLGTGLGLFLRTGPARPSGETTMKTVDYVAVTTRRERRRGYGRRRSPPAPDCIPPTTGRRGP